MTSKDIDDLRPEEVLIYVNYSESYSKAQQDEIQSVYFEHQNFSVFTLFFYYREKEQAHLVNVPMIAISDPVNTPE